MLANLIAALFAVSAVFPSAHQDDRGGGPKNVIVMVADGAGYATWEATSMYQGRWNPGQRSHAGQVYGGPAWLRLGKACWSTAARPGVPADASRRYDPARAWDAAPVVGDDAVDRAGYPVPFRGYQWNRETAPDSAATMTQMMSGVKTYNGAVNVGPDGSPLTSLAELAKRESRAVGVVTSVPISHATPAAAAGAHAASRASYAEIADEILSANIVDVWMGAGHPLFGEDGELLPEAGREYKYVGGRENWESLVAGGHLGRWVLVQEAADFRELAIEGTLGGEVPGRVLGLAKVASTLQQGRTGSAGEQAPYEVPFLDDVPSLATMSVGALRALERRGSNGFFLMVEGGAVDWGMHANQSGRMIEEMIAFNEAVEAVVDWIEDHGGWDANLLVLTADHDHHIYGPGAAEEPFQEVQDRGPRQLPGMRWFWNSHSNHLVPVFARGPGTQDLLRLADEADPVRGSYLDDTELFEAIRSAWGLAPSPTARQAVEAGN